jgi:hypothetical protein
MPFFSFKFTLVLNSAHFFQKLGLGLPTQYTRDTALFTICISSISCRPVRCASDPNVCRDVEAFRTKLFILITFYRGSVFLLKY